MTYNRLTLDVGTSQWVVDNHMGVYFIPFEECDDSYQFHVSELNHSNYERLNRELNAYLADIGMDPIQHKYFLSIAERLFEMYQILRKLP